MSRSIHTVDRPARFFISLLIIVLSKTFSFRRHINGLGYQYLSGNSRYMSSSNSFIDSFYKIWNIDINNGNNRRIEKPKVPINVTRLDDLREKIKEGYRVRDLCVRGNVNTYKNMIRTDETPPHPVVSLLYDRIQNSKVHGIPGDRKDGFKVAVAIEGGGMRGCVAAGMITALNHLKLADSVDVVYGSSAGSLVGAYFISGQLPYEGPEVYYDILTSAGKDFIDSQAILRSIGLGLFDLRFSSFMSLFRDRMGKPVLNLDYLLNFIVQEKKKLNWDIFLEKQISKKQILKVVASGLLSKKAIVFSYENENFQTLGELTQCMRASMLLPGITGDSTRLKGNQANGKNILKTYWREYTSRKESSFVYGSEPYSDALIFEPVPYRSAVKDNCTHVLVLRTRADGTTVTEKMGFMEKLILSRFFGRKQGLPELVNWMHKQYHKLIYAEDILILNRANQDTSTQPMESNFTKLHEILNDGKEFVDWDNFAKLYTIALPEGTEEVKRMETSRVAIFNNVRYGFAASYNALVIDPKLKGKGMEIACQIWPDSIIANEPEYIKNMQLKQEQNKDTKLCDDTLTSKNIQNPNQVSDTSIPKEKEKILEKLLLHTPALKLPKGKRKALIEVLCRLQSYLIGKSTTLTAKVNGVDETASTQ